jgi:hypothetical protein
LQVVAVLVLVTVVLAAAVVLAVIEQHQDLMLWSEQLIQ